MMEVDPSLLSSPWSAPTDDNNDDRLKNFATRLDSHDWTERLTIDDSHSSESDNDNTTTIASPAWSEQHQHAHEPAASLEGVLYWRKGRKSTKRGSTASSLFWKQRYVVLDFQQGSLAAYSVHHNHPKSSSSAAAATPTTTTSTALPLKKSPTKLHRSRSMYNQLERMKRQASSTSTSTDKHSNHDSNHSDSNNQSIQKSDNNNQSSSNNVLSFYIPSSSSWHVKDVANDSSSFVVEIMSPVEKDCDGDESSTSMISTTEVDYQYLIQNATTSSTSTTAATNNQGGSGSTTDPIDDDNATVTTVSTRPSLRFYFKCRNGANEKVLWLKAFAKMDRLSSDYRLKKSLLPTKTSWKRLTRSRTRTSSSGDLLRQSMQLEQQSQTTPTVVLTTPTRPPRRQQREKEHRVVPERCYPHDWMTPAELQEEMEKPSETIYDLSQNPCQLDLPHNPCQKPTIGTLQLEVLQGLGFPKLERSDAVVYVVSGPYAFCTEVIPNKPSPMWLAKSQRACRIPLHHAYARVYVGVFDDHERKRNKDDFNGRVVLDVARLRPNSTYDVTLPLRLSAHVYSRRQRGAIRLRFRLEWTSVRAALLSYLPDKIPRRLNFNLKEFKPHTDTVVTCGSARAFRNVAITVHGAHLPGRFSFQQLRATIREVNFTRKTVLMIVRLTVVELREWQNPLLSAFVFLAWMHCVYQNAFSLVPAYVMLYFWLLLLRNYARYGMDGPAAQQGCVPPSWEELMRGLLLANDSEAIRPLDMGMQLEDDDSVQYRVDTHEPRGKPLFRAMGFLESERDTLDDDDEPNYHLEFPYADGQVYPRFTVEESLVKNKKRRNLSSKTSNHSPKSRSQRLKLGISKMMRKDTSGLNDYDAEEQRFATAKFIRQTGATQLKGAATGLMDVGETLTEATGLQYVVSPVLKGGQYVVSPVLKGGHSAVKGGLHYVVPPLKSGIKTGYSGIETSIRGLNNHVVSLLVVSPLHHTVGLVRRASNDYLFPHSSVRDDDSDDDEDSLRPLDELDERSVLHHRQRLDSEAMEFGVMTSIAEIDRESDNGNDDEHDDDDDSAPRSESDSSASAARLVPDQDIDYVGTNSNSNDKNQRRLTDDLQDVKDQMHQFTFQKFNDRAYVIRDSNSQAFGHTGTSTKRRKGDVKKDMNKLLQIGQYSHSNPVVGRVGQYVEPIVGASHSFLSAFRALFNVVTWQDPFLTFWVSVFGFVLVALLFVFPWRLFLFVGGLWFVGPQNLVYRVLQQRGILPPKKPRARPSRDPEEMQVPEDQMVFQGHISQDQKRKPHKPVDPRQVQYVVVPYSPLMYQRFYDWPPEQEHAQVSSQNHVASDVSAASNGYFSSSVAETKKTQ